MRPPYDHLTYGRLREIHDQIYFGKWRAASPQDTDLEEAHQRLCAFADLLAAEVAPDAPAEQREYLRKAQAELAGADPRTNRAPDLFRAMNAALSYGHRVLDLLLRARGEGNHPSRDFAGHHDLAEGGDE